MDPAIELPNENNEAYYPGGETPQMLSRSQEWLQRLKHKVHGKRTFSVFGEDLQGHSILLCRYLQPLKPPKEVFDIDTPNELNGIEKCARFVSMIPFLEDLKLFKDLPDMYATCQQFLDLGGGDHEEHAILLANFF